MMNPNNSSLYILSSFGLSLSESEPFLMFFFILFGVLGLIDYQFIIGYFVGRISLAFTLFNARSKDEDTKNNLKD